LVIDNKSMTLLSTFLFSNIYRFVSIFHFLFPTLIVGHH